MAEAAATIVTMNKLLRWTAAVVVAGAISWAAYVTTTIQAIGADMAVLKVGSALGSRLTDRIDRLEQGLASMTATRDMLVAEYRLNIARLEAQVEGQRKDIQALSVAITALTAEVKRREKP